MPPIVEGHDAAAGSGERLHPARIRPIGRDIGGKAMDEQDRLSRSLIHIEEPHTI